MSLEHDDGYLERPTDSEPINNKEEESQMGVAVVDLGGNNKGSIGPDVLGIHGESVQELAEKAASAEYRKRASDIYMCVDGRGWAEGAFPFEIRVDEWPTQVAGSKPIQDTAVAFMRQRYSSDHPSKPRLSTLLADKTKQAVASGHKIVVHGDDHKKKAGCGANVNERASLKSNAENIDIVAPLTWSLVELYGLDSYVKQDDVRKLILMGEQNADDDALWDATPEQKVDIMVANGAKYLELVGPHLEAGVAIPADSNETVDARAFARNHQTEDGREAQLFVATLGKAIQDILADSEKAGLSKREAYLDATAAILWNLSVAKELGNEELKAFLLAQAKR